MLGQSGEGTMTVKQYAKALIPPLLMAVGVSLMVGLSFGLMVLFVFLFANLSKIVRDREKSNRKD